MHDLDNDSGIKSKSQVIIKEFNKCLQLSTKAQTIPIFNYVIEDQSYFNLSKNMDKLYAKWKLFN